MAWFSDSLRSAIAAVNPFGGVGQQAYAAPVFTHQLALAAYRSSGLLRKIIRLHANDRVREWRDWQTDKDTIALVEAEEKRLGLLEKVRRAEKLRGIGGGALIIITAGDHAEPLTPEMVAKGGVIAINVVSRWQIRGTDWVQEITSPDHGQPRMWEMQGGTATTKIHPSRVVCFQAERLPEGSALSDEEAFWGDSRISQVQTEVARYDNAQRWFSELVRKAKLLRFGISNLTDYDPDDLSKRVALIAEGENSLNATLYNLPTKDGAGNEAGGEKIDDYQIAWTGIPQMMDAFAQGAATVGDTPFTLLYGRSPAGMNATGEYDDKSWAKIVGMGQELEVRPCLEQIDPFLLRSAGVAAPDKVWWIFAPLDKPSEADEAKTFDLLMTAIGKLIDSGTVPAQALAEAVQNLIEERGYLPGLSGALSKLSEDERFGLTPKPPANDDDLDPSDIQAKGGDPSDLAEAGGGGSVPRRRAANDALSGLVMSATLRAEIVDMIARQDEPGA
jgi:phage-related protein (TIGR01555 family)